MPVWLRSTRPPPETSCPALCSWSLFDFKMLTYSDCCTKGFSAADGRAMFARGGLAASLSRRLRPWRIDQREEFVAGLLVFAEVAQHGARGRGGVLFFDAAHYHAEMAGFDDDADAGRVEFLLDGGCDLAGEALLNL